MDIHRGKDPSVQLVCGEPGALDAQDTAKKDPKKEEQKVGEAPEEPKIYKVKIMFTGDMER